MAIRDRFRRAMHKSASSSSLAPSESNNAMAPVTSTPTITTTITKNDETSSQESSLHREPTGQTGKLAFPWSKTESEKAHHKEEKEKKKQEEKKAKQKKASKALHPRDKPLTATNIRYREQLGDWDFNFGSSSNRMSQLIPDDENLSSFGVSPCCTRPASINGDA